MRRIVTLFFAIAVLTLFPMSVQAMEFTAPEAPDAAQEYMPVDTESFAEGLWSIMKDGIAAMQPSLAEAAGICLSIVGAMVVLSAAKNISGTASKTTDLVGCIVISAMLVRPTNTLIQLGVETVKQISDYGNLLIPVMSTALAAQGEVTASAALYSGTAVFSAILSNGISRLLAPMLYIYLVLAIANAATGEMIVAKLRDFIKWLTTWGLKIALYVFTGYMSVTKVISGSTDAARLKATKLTISGMVPVVGSILSDASESILASAGIMKSTAGVYGLLVIASLWVGPFLRIGVQYLLLKATAAVCEVFGSKSVCGLVKNFSAAMGLALAMTGAVCLMLLISIACFMKGVS